MTKELRKRLTEHYHKEEALVRLYTAFESIIEEEECEFEDQFEKDAYFDWIKYSLLKKEEDVDRMLNMSIKEISSLCKNRMFFRRGSNNPKTAS